MKNTNVIPQTLRVVTGLALALAVLTLIEPGARAGDGTWTNLTSGGLWSATANWSGGSAASGSGSTAYFNTLDLTADNLVHLDGSYTLSGLVFGDLLSATAGGWFLDDNASAGVNKLTLAGTTPTITVNTLGTGKTTTIGPVITGSAGLTKAGAGTLTLTNAEAFTGGLTINGGTVVEDFTSLATPTDLINSANALTLGGGVLSIKGKASSVTSQTLGNITINAGGAQILGNNNSATSTTITLGTLNPTAAGGSLLAGYSTGTSGLTITTTSGTLVNGIYSGREVWFNGTANTGYDWATTATAGPAYTLSGLASGSYTTLPTAATSDALNDVMTANTTLAGAQTHNSLKIGSGLTLANGGFNTILTSGGLLSVGSSASTISGAGTITVGTGSGSYDLVIHQYNSGGLTLSLAVADNGANPVSLVKSGSGTLTVNTNANAYTGNTTINAGTLAFVDPQNWTTQNNNSALGTSSTKTITIQSGATLQVQRATLTGSQLIMNGGTWQCNNGYGETWNGNVVLNADSFFDATGNGGTTTINGNISGVGGLTRSGNTSTSTFILLLNGINTYTGPTIIRSSMVRFPTPASMYNSDTTKWVPGYITVASGATLYVNVGGASDFTTTQVGTLLGNLTTGINNNGLRAGAAFAFDTGNAPSSPATVLSTTIANSTGPGGGALSLKKYGAHTLQLSGANTYTGATTINAGTLQAGVATVPGVSGAFGVNSAVTDSGTLDLNSFDTWIGSLTGSGGVTLGTATLTVGADNTSPAAYSGVMSGASGNLTKIGTGTLTLSGANTYGGTTTISNGIVNLNHAESAGTSGPLGSSIASGSIVLTGGTLQYTALNQYDYSSRFSTAANQAYNVDTINQPITWATALTSSGGTLSKTGTGTLLLSGANTYTGATTVNGGTLKAGIASSPGVSGAFGLNSAVTLANTAGVVLDLAGYDTQIGSLTGGGTAGGNVTNSTATAVTLTVGGDNTSLAAFAGVISGIGANLAKIGTGTLTLNNTETYNGNTTVSGGTLALGVSGALPSTASISIAAGAQYDVSAIASYSFGSTPLMASGTGLTTGAATFKAGAAATMNGRPITLSYTPTGIFGDTTHPALVVTNGNLDLTSVAITVTNNYSPLSAGTFTLVTNMSGTFSGAPSLANNTVWGNGIVAGRSASIGLSADNKAVNLTVSASATPVTVTITRHAGTGTSSTYGDALFFDVTVTTATSGTVTLYDGGITGLAIGSATLPGSTTATVAAALNGLTAGTHANIVAGFSGSGYASTNSTALTPAQVVGPLGLTVTGAVGHDKLFDGTAAATLDGTLVGVVTGDTTTMPGGNVYLIGTGTFNNGGAVGTGLGITSTSTLGGNKATSYTLTQPTGMTASIFNTAVWTNQSSTDWSIASSWTNGLVGSGADVTADFSQIDITHDMLISMDTPRTLGSMVFGDTATGTGGSWLFDNNGQSVNVLTLAGTNYPCTITVNTLGSGKQVTLGQDISMATNVTVTVGSSPLELAGAISGAGGLTKNGSGKLTIDGVAGNYYNGPTIINNGTVHLGAITNGISPDLRSVLGTGPVTVAAGCTIEFDKVTATNALTLNGGTLYCDNGWGANWNGPVTLNANVSVNTIFNITFGGTITGPGAFTKTGAYTLILSAADSSYTGTNSITAGTMQFNSPAAVGTGGMSISGGTANLNYTGTQYIGALILGGVSQPNGNYGSTASGATPPDDTHFTGTGTVTVGPPPVPPAPVLDPSTGFSVAGGNPTFTFSTVAGFKYRLISSDNVATPLADWQGVPIYSPVVSDANGWVVATDISMTLVDQTYTTGSTPQRFYRIEASRP